VLQIRQSQIVTLLAANAPFFTKVEKRDEARSSSHTRSRSSNCSR
jgi:hypothetical protein